MDGYWERVAERERRTTRPTAPASPRSICVADTDAEAERLYGQHVPLLLQPLPARLSGLRRRAGLPHHQDHPGRRAVAAHARPRRATIPDLTWKDLVDGGYVIAGSPETVRQRMEELIKSLRVGNIFCLLHIGNMPDDKVRAFDQAVRREGDAAPAQHVARLEQPRRPLLDAIR